MKRYDAAFVACKEPDVKTGKFPEHHVQTLRRAARLQQAGVIRLIVLSGGYATWYDKHNITPWFGTECDASADDLINNQGRPPQSILRDPRAQNSIANFICSAEDIFDCPDNDINSILVLSAKERLPRLRFLARKTLEGVVEMDFRSTGTANDPWLDTKERFVLAMQKEYLQGIPNGRAGWTELKATAYEGPTLLPFWINFDAAYQAMPSPSEGAILNISDIVSGMDIRGLQPGVMDFAHLTAKNLVLPRQLCTL